MTAYIKFGGSPVYGDGVVAAIIGPRGKSATRQLFETIDPDTDEPYIPEDSVPAFVDFIGAKASEALTDELAGVNARIDPLTAKQRGSKILMSSRTGNATGYGFDVGYRQLRADDLPKFFLGEKRRHIGEAMDDHPRSINWHRAGSRPSDFNYAVEAALDFRQPGGDGRRHIVVNGYGWQAEGYINPARLSNVLMDCPGLAPGAPPTVIAADVTRPILYLDGVKNLRIRGAFHGAYRKAPASTSVRAAHIRGGSSNIYIEELVLMGATAVLYLDNCSGVRIGRVIAPGASVKIIATATAQDVRIGEWVGPGTTSIDAGADVQIGAVLSGLLPSLSALTPAADKMVQYNASGAAGLIDAIVNRSWTPTVSAATPGDMSVAYATQLATVNKFGSIAQVIINLQFTITYTTMSGDLLFSLPFVAVNLTPLAKIPIYSFPTSVSYPNTSTDIALCPTNGTSVARILGFKQGASPTPFASNSLVSGTQYTFRFVGIYPTT